MPNTSSIEKMLEAIDSEIVPPTVFNEGVWDVVDEYFKPNKGYQLVKHQIESFNDFVLRKINQIIDGFNPIEINHHYNPETEKFKHHITLVIEKPTLMKPIIYEKDGSTKNMTPNDARLRNFTYASAINVDVSITARTLNEDGEYSVETKRIQGVSLGKIPIMVKSNYCILKNNSIESNECKYDYGGYFIINGNEKVVISQDRISENKTFVFLSNKVATYSHIAEIRSVQENRLGVPKITSIKLSSKPNQFGRFIRVNIHHIKTDIPLFILMKALGLSNDKEIIEYIVYNCDDKIGMLVASQLMGCVDEANHVMCQRDAIEYLAKYLNITGYPREYMQNKINRINLVRNVLEKEVLPHVGKDLRKKALYIGHMVNKLIQCFVGLKEFDDRDSYINKRVDTPGVLLASIFRQYYGKMIKDMKNMIQKEINVGGWKVSNKLVNVINKVNIYKVVKSTIIDSGLRYALSTGNWGIRSNKNKQGVAQVLNRMSYNATLSHLRRINTPIEKSGKLIQPRKLHATQWGIVCPAETPEGASVGLVKNMAMTANITICANSTNIRELILEHLGVVAFGKDNDYDVHIFHNNTKVIINGDIIGVHYEPHILYNKLKTMKRKGQINVYTSIVWNFQNNEISISTEGGRCVRPLFVVDNSKGYPSCRLTASTLKDIKSGKKTWTQLVTGSGDEDVDDSVIEYMDVEEVNSAMIAMTYDDLVNRIIDHKERGKIAPTTYTNMEIHASLIMGVLGNMIPFSDHNQAPRVAYQCLWKEENVLMANGEHKKIKDVCVGDSVMTFNQETYKLSNSKVVHQFVQPTDKKVFKITTVSGREIIATYDHMFMTSEGWKKVEDFSLNTTEVGVQPTTELCPYTASENVMLSEGKARLINNTMFIKLKSIEEVPNCEIADITVESDNHSFIGGAGFMVHNCSMGKQALGIYTSNFRHRFDTMGHVLNYGQRPLVKTNVSSALNNDDLPCGVNAIVAIATYTGFNQEDSVILNKSAIDRGLFTSTYYRTYKELNNKNHSNGEEEFFTKPDPNVVKNVKPYNYDKLDNSGFVPENTFVQSGDIIIGKVMPTKIDNTIQYKDNSSTLKSNEIGFIDRNGAGDKYFTNTNGDGYNFAKVRIRSDRTPTIGDKFASRSAQKGTCGMMYRQEDMPFTSEGITPDIIVNPHAIPSRMTIGQLMECIMGKACAHLGTFGNATAFNGVKVESLSEILEKCGMERHGNEILYNSRTGEQIHTEIFIGPTYYQRLKHMVCDKVHSRSSNGPIVLLTRQPAEGRCRDGGLRLGEMEVECNWAHGISGFLKERLMECSDNYRVFICKKCGLMANVNPEKNIFSCRNCKNITEFSEIRIPYAAKLLLQEVQTMSIAARFITK